MEAEGLGAKGNPLGWAQGMNVVGGTEWSRYLAEKGQRGKPTRMAANFSEESEEIGVDSEVQRVKEEPWVEAGRRQ